MSAMNKGLAVLGTGSKLDSSIFKKTMLEKQTTRIDLAPQRREGILSDYF